MNITKRTKSEGTTVYQFRVFLSQSADGKQRTRSKTWQPPAGMTAKAAEKEAKRQAVIFENEVKQGRAALDARTKLSDVAREYIRNTEMEYKTKEWYEYMLHVVEDDIGNMPISALKAYQIERIYADMREPDAKRTYCVTATELDKIRKEKGMTYKVLAEKAGLCIDTVQIACKGCRVSLESADKMAKVLQCAVDKAFKLEVRKSPYSSTTINGVHRFLRAVCHYAEKHKLLTDNPIDAVRAPKIDAEIYVFSEEESARFIRAVMREKDIRVKTALLILIYLGLRKGELCGLTWGSVDLGKGIVHVAQQLKEKSGEGLILGKLKTKESKADLPLSPMLAEVLAEYRQWWNEHKAMYGDAWRGEWEYIPFGFIGREMILTDAAMCIPNAGIYEFGILESNVHMAWMRAIGGRIKSDYRYSKDIVYNNFPWPTPNEQQKAKIEQTAQAILDARALYPDSSLADLYDELTMPPELRKAHQANDRAVMDAYGFIKGTAARTSESACVAELMKLYQQKISAAQSE